MSTTLSLPAESELDSQMLDLARHVAMGMQELPAILTMMGISNQDYQRIRVHSRFQAYLTSAIAEWNAAVNTPERVKLKAAAIMENWLLEANAQLHNKTAALNHKVELAKVVGKLAGLGESQVQLGGAGSGFQLTINIGDGHADKLTIRPVTTKVIDADDDYDYFTSPNTLED